LWLSNITWDNKTKIGDHSEISSICLYFTQSNAWDLRLVFSFSFIILGTGGSGTITGLSLIILLIKRPLKSHDLTNLCSVTRKQWAELNRIKFWQEIWEHKSCLLQRQNVKNRKYIIGLIKQLQIYIFWDIEITHLKIFSVSLSKFYYIQVCPLFSRLGQTHSFLWGPYAAEHGIVLIWKHRTEVSMFTAICIPSLGIDRNFTVYL
jgi:hypothetical protein